jgi:hypothetical protein
VNAPSKTRPRQTPWFGIDTGLFFILFYLYVLEVVDPRLIHHSLGIFTRYFDFNFSTGWPFFREHLAGPGGLVEYGARLCSQLYRFAWAGALIVTVSAWCMCLCMDVLARLAGRPRGMVVRYAPAAVLLMIYGTYDHPSGILLALVLALTCFVLYSKLAPKGLAGRLGVLLVACASLYYAAGAGSLLFPMLVAVHESLVRRRILLSVAAVLCGLGAPWLAASMFPGFSVRTAYTRFLLADPGVVWEKWPYALVLNLLFPLALVMAALWRAAGARKSSDASDFPPPAGASRIRKALVALRRWRGVSKWTLQMAIVLAVAGTGAWLARDTGRRVVLDMDYSARNGEWTEVLEIAKTIPPRQYNLRCSRNVLLALQHTGRLGDEMFRYPQTYQRGVFTMSERGTDFGAWFDRSRILLDLGHVNMAEKCAYEALETTGDLPAVLEHLAVINIVKNRTETARVFLNALSKSLFHRGRAREMLGRIDKDPSLKSDSRIQKMRSVMVEKDTVQFPAFDAFLLMLLEKNRKNKMAFDFLMAHYLLSRQPEKVLADIPRLDDFGHKEIPRYYQEAAVVHLGFEGSALEIPGRRLDPEIIQKFRKFSERLGEMNKMNRSAAAKEALAPDFRDTYFYYFAFGETGS